MASDEDERKDVLMDRRTMLKGAAAAGLLGTGVTGTATAAGWREITFCATGNETFSYWVQVDGAVKRGGRYQSDRWDEVGDDYVEGAASEGRCDSFLIKGEIVDSELSGPGEVKVGGEAVEVTEPAPDGEPKQVRFKSVSDAVFRYRVSVSGTLEREPNRDGYDTQIDENTAKGAASGGGFDDWRFTGEITELELSGPGQVLIDGEVVRDTRTDAPEEDGDETDGELPNVVIVSSPGLNEYRDYQFRVTGDLVKLEPNEDTGRARDEVIDLGDRGTRVRGSVRSGDDRFAYSGQLVREDVPEGVQLETRRR